VLNILYLGVCPERRAQAKYEDYRDDYEEELDRAGPHDPEVQHLKRKANRARESWKALKEELDHYGQWP